MSTTFINSPEDMQWLRETHLKCAPQYETAHFKSAIIHGNEDCPEQLELYLEQEPVVIDTPFRLWLHCDGEYFNYSQDAEPDAKPGANEVFGDSN